MPSDGTKAETDATLVKLLDRYARRQTAISVDFRRIVPELSSPDRATHLIHPYPAKLLTHIPYFFLRNSILSETGDTVIDPFCGSGTVLLEAQLAGRQAVGADINPLAHLITKVKTSPLCVDTLDRATTRLLCRLADKPQHGAPDVVNLHHWFYPHVTRQLQCLHEAINVTRNHTVREFFRVCFSNCVRRVSLCDPRLSVPVRLTQGQYPAGHYLREKTDAHLRRLRRISVKAIFLDVLEANRRRMLSLHSMSPGLPPACVVQSDARCLQMPTPSGTARLRSHTVQLAITSPPYPGAQKYIRASSLSLGWLGLCATDELKIYKHRTIGREEFRHADFSALKPTGVRAADHSLRQMHMDSPIRAAIAATYLCEMRESLCEIWRILKDDGFLVLVAANSQINGRQFRTQHYLRLIAEDLGFRTRLRLIDAIRSRGLMTKRNKTASMITREWVLVFSKRNT